MDFNQTENQYAVLAESLPQLVWSARPDGYHDYFNRRWQEFTGLALERCLGDGWQGAIHPQDLPQVLAEWQGCLRTSTPFEGECRIRGASGRYAWMLGRAIPIQDLSGRIVRWFGTFTNIDEQKKAEEDLRILDDQYRLALKAARLGTWTIDLERNEVSWDEGTSTLHEMQREGLYSLPLEDALARVHPDDRDTVRAGIAAARTSGRYEVEYRAALPDGGLRWIRSHGQALPRRSGDASWPTRLSGVIADITERRALEEAQSLLTQELNHRVKNLFAIANGMVSMTARTAKDPKEMAAALRGRLSALSRAHELVQPPAPSGRGGGAASDLLKLIEAVLEPYRPGGTSRVLVEGPSVAVGSNTTTSLALVLHELATNAAKYGCLSQGEGRLAIRWTLDAGTVDLLWTESGGPPIATPPSFEGFGTQLSQRSITGQLGGTLEREWRREGLVVHVTLPLDRLAT